MAREYKIKISRPGGTLTVFWHDDNQIEFDAVPMTAPFDERVADLEEIKHLIAVMRKYTHTKWVIQKL